MERPFKFEYTDQDRLFDSGKPDFQVYSKEDAESGKAWKMMAVDSIRRHIRLKKQEIDLMLESAFRRYLGSVSEGDVIDYGKIKSDPASFFEFLPFQWKYAAVCNQSKIMIFSHLPAWHAKLKNWTDLEAGYFVVDNTVVCYDIMKSLIKRP